MTMTALRHLQEK